MWRRRRAGSTSVILDLWSRRVVGWSTGTTLQACLVVAALQMALKHRHPLGVCYITATGACNTPAPNTRVLPPPASNRA